MQTLEVLNNRRSVRNFDPSITIPKEDLDKIISAALNSPSAMNLQEHDLVVITNKEKIAEVDKIVFPLLSPQIKDRFKKRQEEFGTINIVTYDSTALVLIFENERVQEKWGNLDAGILSMGLMVAAEALGYNSVTLGVVALPEVGKLFGIEKKLIVGVAIGKPKKNVNIHPSSLWTTCKTPSLFISFVIKNSLFFEAE